MIHGMAALTAGMDQDEFNAVQGIDNAWIVALKEAGADGLPQAVDQVWMASWAGAQALDGIKNETKRVQPCHPRCEADQGVDHFRVADGREVACISGDKAVAGAVVNLCQDFLLAPAAITDHDGDPVGERELEMNPLMEVGVLH